MRSLPEEGRSGLVSSTASASRGSESKRICPAIEQILKSTFVYLQITTGSARPGQASPRVCGQRRPRELAQQGKSPVERKYPVSLSAGRSKAHERRRALLRLPLLFARDALCPSGDEGIAPHRLWKSFPPRRLLLEPLRRGGRADGCSGRESSVGEGWSLANLGMFSSFGQIAYSLKNQLWVGQRHLRSPAKSGEEFQPGRKERKGKIKKPGKCPFSKPLFKTNISGLSFQITFSIDICLFNNICF